MEAIPLRSLLPHDFDPTHCKVHFAVWNQIKHPIDVLASSPEEWQGWNSWRSDNNDFNRQFIFSVAQDKHDASHWLFGGIWEVLERRPEPHAHSYTVTLREDLLGPFVRRLWVRHKRSGRNIRQKMETGSDGDDGVLDPRRGVLLVTLSRGTIGSTTRSPISRPSSAKQRPDWRIALGEHEGRLRHP